MPAHITLNEDHFRRLIVGEAVELEGVGEVILADFGFKRMVELVAEAVGAVTLVYRADVDEFISIHRNPDGGWSAECSDHSWATGGPLELVGKTLGAHLREEHELLRVEDWSDIFAGVRDGLRGHSQRERSE